MRSPLPSPIRCLLLSLRLQRPWNRKPYTTAVPPSVRPFFVYLCPCVYVYMYICVHACAGVVLMRVWALFSCVCGRMGVVWQVHSSTSATKGLDLGEFTSIFQFVNFVKNLYSSGTPPAAPAPAAGGGGGGGAAAAEGGGGGGGGGDEQGVPAPPEHTTTPRQIQSRMGDGGGAGGGAGDMQFGGLGRFASNADLSQSQNENQNQNQNPRMSQPLDDLLSSTSSDGYIARLALQDLLLERHGNSLTSLSGSQSLRSSLRSGPSGQSGGGTRRSLSYLPLPCLSFSCLVLSCLVLSCVPLFSLSSPCLVLSCLSLNLLPLSIS